MLSRASVLATGLGILSPKSITTDDNDCDDDSLSAIQGYTTILPPLRHNSCCFIHSRNIPPSFFPPSANPLPRNILSPAPKTPS